MRMPRILNLAMAVLIIISASNPAWAQTTAIGLDEMLFNFVKNMQGPLVRLISVVAICIGIVYMGRGFLKLTKLSEGGGRQSLNGAITTLMIGSILMSMPTALSNVASTLAINANPDFSVISYSNVTADAQVKKKMRMATMAVFGFMQIIGLISFIRGFGILREVSDGASQQASVMAGFTHIIAGTFAFNLMDFVNMIQTTLGITGSIFS